MTTEQAQAALTALEADSRGDSVLAHALRQRLADGDVCGRFNSSI